jgi:hypothetical protein
LDEATKGVTGHPHIATTIRRKISKCGVFLADLTHVAEYTTADGRKKRAQNGNVLIELGMAIKAKGFGRLILVMNDAFGSPEDLPFDLKSHSFPITYTLADTSDPAKVKTAKEGLAKAIGDKLKPMLAELSEADTEQLRQMAEAEEAASRQRAEERWKDFDHRVWTSSFRGLRTSRVYVTGDGLPPPPPKESFMALSVVPLKPLPRPLDIAAIEQANPSRLIPIGRHRWHTEGYGRALVHHDGSRRGEDGQAESPTTVLELNDDGSIFAAARMAAGTHRRGGARILSFEGAERDAFRYLTGYVGALRELRVEGPLEIRVTLLGVRDTYLHPANPLYADSSKFRPLKQDRIHIEPVTLSDDVDGTNEAAVAVAMHPAFKLLWREAGVPGDPCFKPDGTYDQR